MDYYVKKTRKSHPRERANVLSLLTFGYTFGIFKKALKRDFEEKDLYEVLSNCRSKNCGDETEKHWQRWRQRHHGRTSTASLIWLLFVRFGGTYAFITSVHLTWGIIRSIVKPWALSNLIASFNKSQIINGTEVRTLNKDEATHYGFMLSCLYILGAFYYYNIIMVEQRLAIQIRSSLCSLLYRKVLASKSTVNSQSSSKLGKIVTLMSKDVNVMDDGIWMLCDSIMDIVQISIVCYLMLRKIGLVSFVGIGFLSMVLALQIFLGRSITAYRLEVAKRSDERLQIMQEVLSSIKIIKMYTWENVFQDRIANARKKEVRYIMRVIYRRFIMTFLGMSSSKIGFFLLIMSYIWLGYDTDTELIFYLLSLFNELKHPLNFGIPFAVAKISEFYACLMRITAVLNEEDGDNEQTSDIQVKDIKSPYIEFKNVSIKVNSKEILENISFATSSNELIAVTGFVGCGKSILLKSILGTFQNVNGDIRVFGKVSYSSQEPWIFPSSLKQNILFGQKFNLSRYNKVLQVCALNYDISNFPDGDETILNDKGMNLSKGQQARINLARAVYREADIYLLDDCLAALDANVQDYIYQNCVHQLLNNKLVLLVTQNEKHLKAVDKVLALSEGRLVYFGPPKNFEPLPEVMQEQLIIKTANGDAPKINALEEKEEEQKLLKRSENIYHEVKKTGTVKLDVYKKYLSMGGGIFVCSIILLFYISAQFTENYSDKLLSKWVDQQQNVMDILNSSKLNSTTKNLSIYNSDHYLQAKKVTMNTFSWYTSMVVSSTILSLIKYYLLFQFFRKASYKLHNLMSSNVLNADMVFFDRHLIGNILNRFSQDLHNIDENLSSQYSQYISIVFDLCGSIILISTVDLVLFLPPVFYIAILIFLRMGFFNAARSLKRIEVATRSPMIGYVNATMEGLETVHAFQAEQALKNEFDKHQDLFSSARYTMHTALHAFGFISDIFCTIVIISIIFMLIYLDSDISAGDAGLAVNQLTNVVVCIHWSIVSFNHLENDMTSAERALEYVLEIEQESKSNSSGPLLKDWPQHGKIVFENVSLTHDSNSVKVLDNISFTVTPGQKFGIVGRTGAGKSSLISVLYRLYDYEGKILIDDVDIKTVGLSELRQKIAIIPQDPVVYFGSSIRANIDPNGQFSDEEIWHTLKQVNLDKFVRNLDEEVGSERSFSAGEKQMVCLARAIIRKCRIAVLDEATASLDQHNEQLLLDLIERNLNCTVLTVAHKLRGIVKCDQVLVIEGGKVVEMGRPAVLINDTNSTFSKMIAQSSM